MANLHERTAVISCTFRLQNASLVGTRALPVLLPGDGPEDASLVEVGREDAPLAAAAWEDASLVEVGREDAPLAAAAWEHASPFEARPPAGRAAVPAAA